MNKNLVLRDSHAATLLMQPLPTVYQDRYHCYHRCLPYRTGASTTTTKMSLPMPQEKSATSTGTGTGTGTSTKTSTGTSTNATSKRVLKAIPLQTTNLATIALLLNLFKMLVLLLSLQWRLPLLLRLRPHVLLSFCKIRCSWFVVVVFVSWW